MFDFLKSIFATSSATAKNDNPSQEQSEELLGYIQRDVYAGFLSPEEIVDSAVDVLSEGEGSEKLQHEAKRITAECIQQHLTEQANWPSLTDCDRLDNAFSELESLGIISRQNFTCCGTCGTAEIRDEIGSAIDSGRPAHGYTFYHMQDTESAVEGHGLYLNYGSTIDSESAAVAVGHQIVEVLKRHNLDTDWDGSLKNRISVSLDWKRRRIWTNG
jgi:hypothetical protein